MKIPFSLLDKKLRILSGCMGLANVRAKIRVENIFICPTGNKKSKKTLFNIHKNKNKTEKEKYSLDVKEIGSHIHLLNK